MTWYSAWKSPQHVATFDRQARLPAWLLKKSIERFHEGQMLREVLANAPVGTRLTEIGCATGELSRYVRTYFPQIHYRGYDVSGAAIKRAYAKYSSEQFNTTDTLLTHVEAGDIVFCRDVVHHQTAPWDFLDRLYALTRSTLILRLRTRETGKTELNPLDSYQMAGAHPVPYLILNREELSERMRWDWQPPPKQVTTRVHHMILGGKHGRYVPKACSESASGTAETAVCIRKTGVARPWTVTHEPEQLSWPLPYALAVRLYGAA